MFLTITNQNTPVTLHNPVDNRCGNFKVALHEFFYKVKWLNISKERQNNWVKKLARGGLKLQELTIPDGYYGFCALKEMLSGFGITLKLNQANLKITITIKPDPDGDVILFDFAEELVKMLGFSTITGNALRLEVTEDDNTFEGQYPVNLAKHTLLFVHLDELNTDANLYNGRPSTVLRVLPSENTACCDHEIKTFTNLQFKNLVHGHHEKLSLRITDRMGEKIKCEDLHALLEIIEN